MRYDFKEMVEEAAKCAPFKGARVGLKLPENHVVVRVLDDQDRLVLRRAAFRYDVLRNRHQWDAVIAEIGNQARHAVQM